MAFRQGVLPSCRIPVRRLREPLEGQFPARGYWPISALVKPGRTSLLRLGREWVGTPVLPTPWALLRNRALEQPRFDFRPSATAYQRPLNVLGMCPACYVTSTPAL